MMIRLLCACLPAYFFLLTGCSTKAEKPRFTLLTDSNIDFENRIQEQANFNVFKYRNFYNGGGVATGDLNNDGLSDIFFTGNSVANKLYLNKGNLKFEDISANAGFGSKEQWSTGVVLVDINNDGWLDIYLCNAGNMMNAALRKNQLFINKHDLTFKEEAEVYGLADSGYTTHASFFDYDKDGDLDCFLVNNSPIPVNTLNYANSRAVPAAQAPVADFLKGGGDHLYRNDNGHFSEVTYNAGLHGSIIGFGLGVSISDVNEDGWPDVYVSNDFFERDYLYINQQNGKFKDELEERMQHISLSSMGADIQDINNDGHIDLFTTDMLPGDDYRLKTNSSFESFDVLALKKRQGFYNQFTQNALQVNDGRGHFLETGFYSGVAATDWSWGALIFDADNDGLNDIVVSNGIYRDVTDQDFIDFFADEVMQRMVLTGKKEDVSTVIEKMPSVPISNKAYRNLGNLKFADASAEWGLDKPGFSNGAAYADLDNDGDLDLVINNVNEPAQIYRNNTAADSSANYIQVNLKYVSPNMHAIGSTVRVFTGNAVLTRELYPSHGFQSSVDYKLHFGLPNKNIDSITITWPNDAVQTIVKPQINKLHTFKYEATNKNYTSLNSVSPAPFYLLADSFFSSHKEDEIIDFYKERNIPFMMSTQGPKAAVADVDKNGFNDVFIGGARNQPSALYLQNAGGFALKTVSDFVTYKFSDVTAAVFFDADGDGDADLITGAGGNFSGVDDQAYINLLYINDGAGNFSLLRGALPVNGTNCAVITPLDYNSDGKTDLFIGNRSVAQQYGLVPASHLFRNDGNLKFTDVTSTAAPEFEKLGMITDAFSGDNKKQITLTVCGEWMAPKTFVFDGKKFWQKTNGLENYFGLWQRMQQADLDNDGDEDLILANIGENFYLKADSVHPAKLWVADFDKNGQIDKFLTTSFSGTDMPVFLKRDVTDQIPSLKGASLRHHEFAKKDIRELLGGRLDKNNTPAKINTMYSAIAWNNGNGIYTITKLPLAAQLTSLHAINVLDYNNDGMQDILVAGNFFDLLPQFCRLDAGYGLLLTNQGNKKFKTEPASVSGIVVKGAVRDIVIPAPGSLLFLVNNDRPVLYKSMKE